MFNVVFSVKRGDIGTSQGASALETEEVKSTEIIGFTEGILPRSIFSIERKEFGSDNLTAVGALEAVQMIGASKCANKLTGKGVATFLADADVAC
jgi:hypothetical protein